MSLFRRTALLAVLALLTAPRATAQVPAATPALAREILAEVYGPLPVIPYMEMGATDGVHLRNAGQQVFGIIGLFAADEFLQTLHGNDERVPRAAYDEMVIFTRQLLQRLSR